MRFKRCAITKEIYKPDPKRSLAAAGRHIEKERAKVPLFADQLEFDTPEQRVERLEESKRRWTAEFRQHVAQTWRECRRALNRLPKKKRLALRREWDDRGWLPASCEYFADFLRKHGVDIDKEAKQ